jgi:RHS repeat-associated protein
VNYTGSGPNRCYTAQYDATGNPIVLTDPERSCTVSYDDLDRVSSVTCDDGSSESYAYNALGALSLNADVTLDAQRPRLDGQGTAAAGLPATLAGQQVITDPVGRISGLAGETFTWNHLGRVSTGTGGFGEVGYDSSQQRIFQRAEAFAYEGPNVVAVANNGGTILTQYGYDGIDHPLWMYNAQYTHEWIYWYELDTLGNVRRLRNGPTPQGPYGGPPADLGGYKYTAFGKLLPEDAGTPYPKLGLTPIDQPLRWQGRWYYPTAGGLYDFRNRIWSPELGAFLSPDDFGYLTPTGTLWSWPGQNPMANRDPFGLGLSEDDPRAPLVMILNLLGFGDTAAVVVGHQNALDAAVKGDVDTAECEARGILEASASAAAGAVTLLGAKRFFSDTRKWPSIRRAHWGKKGGAKGKHLHHWFFTQRRAASRGGPIPDRIVNAGWNLFELPGSLNSAMSPARTKYMSFGQRAFYGGVEWGITLGIPASIGASAYGGYELGSWAADNW